MLFKDAVTSYITNLTTPRRRGPLSANTKRLCESYARKLDKHFGTLPLEDVRNGRVREFITALRADGLADGTIIGIFGVLKSSIASVTDQDGNPLYNPNFNKNFLTLPFLEKKDQRCATAAEIERAILSGNILVPFLAATGLRVSEALVITVGTEGDCYDPATGLVHIRATLKTTSAARSVLVPENFRLWLNARIPSTGRLFPNTYQQIYDALQSHGLPQCHAYRRFRVTHLRKARMQEDVLRAQLGHSKKSITDSYSYAADDEKFLRTQIEAAGVGFDFQSAEVQAA
jgi:integrase